MKMLNKSISAITSSLKTVFLSKFVKRYPVIVKDMQTTLLKDKNVIITGGNSGIGLAIAKKMIEAGANVTIIGRNKDKTISVANDINCRWVLIIIFFEILIPPEPFMRDAPHFFYRKYNKNLL
jgi:FlaA1/EpsC-like NDP-sugar epimerase